MKNSNCLLYVLNSIEDYLSENHNSKLFQRIRKSIISYFNGKKVKFNFPIDRIRATEFQKSVWKETSKIPYGTTTSYGEIAERIGKPKSYRAVGNALGANPLPIIIPCHRVVSSNGSLGGFSGGLKLKKFLLELEKKHKNKV